GEEDPPRPSPAKGPGPWRRLRAWVSRRGERAEHDWRFLDAELHRTRLLFKVVALHLRYTFGYLAFGFLVSAPIQLGFRHEEGWLEGLFKSVVLGALFAVPALLLWPFSNIDWGRMRIPEFKNLELALTRWAAVLAALWLAVAFVVEKVLRSEGVVGWLCDTRVAWTNLGLMFFSWVRVKFHTLMFREFYTLKPDDDLVLRVPPSRLRLLVKGGLRRGNGDEVEGPPSGAVSSAESSPPTDAAEAAGGSPPASPDAATKETQPSRAHPPPDEAAPARADAAAGAPPAAGTGAEAASDGPSSSQRSADEA
ncbi:MAG: hypothetical protein D6731_04500, partial [Planctomycetota bacterium]